VCCSRLQCAAVCCSRLQCVACVLQCVAVDGRRAVHGAISEFEPHANPQKTALLWYIVVLYIVY